MIESASLVVIPIPIVPVFHEELDEVDCRASIDRVDIDW